MDTTQFAPMHQLCRRGKGALGWIVRRCDQGMQQAPRTPLPYIEVGDGLDMLGSVA